MRRRGDICQARAATPARGHGCTRGVPIDLHLAPRPAHNVLAHSTPEEPEQRAVHPPRVGSGQIHRSDQRLGLPGQPLVARQRPRTPFRRPAVFLNDPRTRHAHPLGPECPRQLPLPAGGRLAAITSAGCIPGDAAWSLAFERLDPPPRTVFSIAIDGRRLRTARHARNRSRFHQCPGRSDRRTGIRPHRRRVACSHHRQCAATASGRANSRCACSGRRSVRPCRHTAGPTKAHSGHRAQHQTRSPASPRLGAGSRTRLRDPARRRARHGKRTGGNPYRGLRALAPPDRAHSRRLRTSDTAGAIRRHGGAHKIDRRKLVPYVRRSREAGMSLSWLREMGL